MDMVVTLEQIPNDPLSMPPPYWRSSGAIFHLLDSLESLVMLLYDLLPVHEDTELQLCEYYEKHIDESSDPEFEEFGNICDKLWAVEHKIKLKTEVAILMSAIQAEDDINMFCVYNLPKDVAESIERLSPSEKLLIASSVVGQSDTKSQAVFEAIKKLSNWRNAFAHGHCVDRPVKSLRHNHLIPPLQYPSVPGSLVKLKEMVESYAKVSKYLNSISLNPYTKGNNVDLEQAEDYLKEVARFKFEVVGDSNHIYIIRMDED
jgi:hypothetical protein